MSDRQETAHKKNNKTLINSQENLMNILDLNHIEAVDGNEVIGGYKFPSFGADVKFGQDVGINIEERIKKDIDVKSDIDVNDNTAIVDGQSTASGNVTFTEVIGLTDTTPGSSASKVVGISFSGGKGKK
ncbi:MAG: hypothetical protein AAFW70_00425 [Cyanobacteria bacterium J06635_10]